MDVADARRQLGHLGSVLTRLVDRDPEQEIQGIALPALDAALSAMREVLPGHVVVAAMRDVISPEMLDDPEPVRAADALVVVEILRGALPPEDDGSFGIA